MVNVGKVLIFTITFQINREYEAISYKKLPQGNYEDPQDC